MHGVGKPSMNVSVRDKFAALGGIRHMHVGTTGYLMCIGSSSM